jgi:predicted glycoside hydrolase/deacetylase ChbG (UPF0249 family)
MRHIIVNADDFGLSPGVNRGIVMAHEQGIVMSASLMVRGHAAQEAAAYARAHPRFSVGLHLELCEYAFQGGEWVELYRVVDRQDADAVTSEVARQLEAFADLVGRPPTHLDSHQHVHRNPPVRDILLAAGARLDVPVRHFTPGVAYSGDFYGQDDQGQPYPELVSATNLMKLVARLPPGVTELCCHPSAEEVPGTMYSAERSAELAALCDPRVRKEIGEQGMKLISFLDLDLLGKRVAT